MKALWLVVLAACGGGIKETAPAHNEAPVPTRTYEPKLRGAQRERFDKLSQSLASPCGKAHSLMTSLATDPACTRTPHALKYLERLIAADTSEDELRTFWEGRYVQGEPKHIDVSRAALVGGKQAGVQLIVFEDLQCPHCAAFAPIVEAIEAQFGDRIAVYYKHFPLQKPHPHARAAAIAAVAADRQGKFLPMTRLLFANQAQLTPTSFEQYAQQLGLDLDRFRADLASPEVASIVDADAAEADQLQLMFVPTLFVNGRQYRGAMDQLDLVDVVDEELEAAEQ